MPIDINDNVFEGKTFSDLMKDIYDNQSKKKDQIFTLVTELSGYVKTAQDAAMIVPLIKEYLEVGVRNDEQLVKLAAIFQKIMASENRNEVVSKSTNTDGNGMLISESEKNDLLTDYEDFKSFKREQIMKESDVFDVNKELSAEMSKIANDVEKMKKTKNIINNTDNKELDIK